MVEHADLVGSSSADRIEAATDVEAFLLVLWR